MRMLVAVDGSDCAWHALTEALRLCPRGLDEVHVITVAKPTVFVVEGDESRVMAAIDRTLKEAQATLGAATKSLADVGARVTGVVREGDPATEILAYAALVRPDLIVLGSQGHGRLGRLFLGSVSDAVAHRWEGTVMIVRPPEAAAA